MHAGANPAMITVIGSMTSGPGEYSGGNDGFILNKGAFY